VWERPPGATASPASKRYTLCMSNESNMSRTPHNKRAEHALWASLGLVIYTFVGYPALIGLAARVRPRSIALDAAFEPTVSLIITAYNEEDVIGGKIANSHELDYPADRLEILVVADGSDDATAERASETRGTRVLHQSLRQGKLAAMVRGAEAAKGDVLLFSDANNFYTPQALRALVAPFADRKVGVVSGRKVIDDGSGRSLDRAEGAYWRYESAIKTWESATGSAAAVAGEILAFRREAFLAPKQGFLTEDFVQAMLAALEGWRIVYAPDALSIERASGTVHDEASRRGRIVSGRWQALVALLPRLIVRKPGLALKVISHKGLRPLVPAALVTAGLANARVAQRRPVLQALLLGQAVFYFAALVGFASERARGRTRWLFLPYYFCRMNIATAAGFCGFLRRRDASVWKKVDRG
jgi:biofilm PGA synthesis N-glycosyltransferase PgaC